MHTIFREGSAGQGVTTIGVAVSFDDRLGALITAAATLASRTGARLRLVHVCDPWTKSYLAPAVEAGPPELVQVLREEVVRTAERRLNAVRRLLPASLPVETAVLDGDIVRNLATDAEENDVGLMVAGVTKGGIAGTVIGFSTAVSLIGEGAAPIMALNEDTKPLPTTGPWTIVVADDFTDVSQAALALGFSLAMKIEGATLVHLHVEGHGDGGRRRRQSSSVRREELTPERFRQGLRRAEEQMLERSEGRSASLETKGGSYLMEVVTGAVAEEISRTVAATGATLVVFGQHRVFHRNGAHEGHIGQVPFKTMLSLSCPVMIVPQQT